MCTRHLRLPDDTTDIGWRLRQLRLHRGLALHTLAEHSGKHTSQISRVERAEARRGKPKRETVTALLDAMDATPAERRAIFHAEQPELTKGEIEAQVAIAAREFGSRRTPMALVDEHWYRWYLNPAARILLGLSPDEYTRSIGGHGLIDMVDPDCPLYDRYPQDARKRLFSWRAAAFQFHFADQEFDRWYLRIAKEISRFYWAYEIWKSPPEVPSFPDKQAVTFVHASAGPLNILYQLNTLYGAPRFALIDMTPVDAASMRKLDALYDQAGTFSE